MAEDVNDQIKFQEFFKEVPFISLQISTSSFVRPHRLEGKAMK